MKILLDIVKYHINEYDKECNTWITKQTENKRAYVTLVGSISMACDLGMVRLFNFW